MAFDPVDSGQQLVRSVGSVLRRPAKPTRRVDSYDEEQLGVEYERGERAFALLAERIQRFTGAEVAGRRALDYGCGMGRLAVPLAQRCERLYGLDIYAEGLEQADEYAKHRGVANVEWSDAGRLPELAGSYDLAISMFVFQHIPSREGERLFATILSGLAPGGVGAIHFSLRPGRRAGRSPAGRRGIKWGYPYMLVHSYSLNRIARLLADEGISEWHVKWHETVGDRGAFDSAVVFFKKD